MSEEVGGGGREGETSDTADEAYVCDVSDTIKEEGADTDVSFGMREE